MTGTRLLCSFLHRTLLYHGDTGGNANHDPGTENDPPTDDSLNEIPEHLLGNIIIGNYAVSQGANSLDIARRTANHPLCFLAHSEDFLCITIYGDDRRLPKDYTFTANINQYIRSTQIYADIHIHAKHYCKPSNYLIYLQTVVH